MALPKVGVEAVVENANGYLKSIKSIVDANDSAADSVKGTAKTFDVLNDTTDYARSVQKRYTETLKEARSALDDSGGSANIFKDGISAAATAVGASIAVFGAVASAIGFIGNVIGDVARRVLDLGKSIFDTGVNFSKIMANIGAVTKQSGEELHQLSNDLISIGMDAVAGPTAVADAYYDVASGITQSNLSMAVLTASIKTAEAGQADLKATTNGMISVINAYDFGLQGIVETSNNFTQAVNKGKGTMNEFVAALSPIASTASSLNVGFTELSASLAFLTQKGLTAGQAGTALAGIMTQLSRRTPGITKALRAMGEQSVDTAIANHGLAGTLKLLSDGAKKTGQNLQTLVGRQEAMKAVTNLGTEAFEKWFSTYMQGLDEATNKSREIQRLDVSAQMSLVQARLEGISLSISQAVLPAFAKFLKFINDGFAKLDWEKITAGLDKVGEKLGAAAENLIGVLGKQLESIDWDKLSTDIANAATSIGNFIAGINWTAVIEGAKVAFKTVGDAVGGMLGFFGGLFNTGKGYIEAFGGVFGLFFGEGGLIQTAATTGSQMFAIAMGVINQAAGTAGMIVTIAGGIIQAAISGIGEVAQVAGGIVSSAWDTMQAAAATAGMIITIAAAGIQFVIGKIVEVAESVRASIGGIFDAIGKLISGPLDAAKNVVDGLVSAISTLLGFDGRSVNVNVNTGLIGGAGPTQGARGGTLQEGLNIVGEQGAEAIVKHGSRAVVVSHANSERLLDQAQAIGMPNAGATALNSAMSMLNAMAPAPALAYGRPAAMPIPIGGDTNNTNNVSNSRNMNINFNGVPNSESAMQKFSVLKATGKW